MAAATGERVSRTGEVAPLLLLFGLNAIAVVAWRSHFGIADADTTNMASGLARALRPGATVGGSLDYGAQISLGVYQAFPVLYPWFFHDRFHVVEFLNGVATIAALLLPLPLYGIFRWRFTPAVAAAGALVASFAPILLSSGASFHPTGPMIALLASAVWVFGAFARRSILAAVLATLLFYAALSVRTEAVFALPGLLWAAWAADRRAGRARLLPLALGGALLAALVYAAAYRAIAPPSKEGLLHYARQWLIAYFDPRAIPRNALSASFAIGPLTAALAALVLLRRRAFAAADAAGRAGLVAALLVVVGTAGFWLMIGPRIPRHFIVTTPAVVWLVCEGLLRARRGLALAGLAAGIVVANLAIPEGFYLALNATRPGRPAWPSGALFSERMQGDRVLAREQSLEKLALCDGPGDPAGPPGPCRGAVALVDFHGAGVLLLAMAEHASDFAFVRESGTWNGATLREYRLGRIPVRVLSSANAAIVPGPARETSFALVGAALDSARAAGFAVVMPREFFAAGAYPDSLLEGARLY